VGEIPAAATNRTARVRRDEGAKTSALRYDEDTITDTMWMLAPDAYVRLVHDAGWPVERFQAWLADLLQRMFLGESSIDSAPLPPDRRAGRRASQRTGGGAEG